MSVPNSSVWLGGGFSCLACGNYDPDHGYSSSKLCKACPTCGFQAPARVTRSAFHLAVAVRDAALTAKEAGIDATTTALKRMKA